MLTILLSHLRGQLNLTADALTFLVAVIAVALAGGMVPAVLEMLAASLLLDFYFIAPVHTFRIMDPRNAARHIRRRVRSGQPPSRQRRAPSRAGRNSGCGWRPVGQRGREHVNRPGCRPRRDGTRP